MAARDGRSRERSSHPPSGGGMDRAPFFSPPRADGGQEGGSNNSNHQHPEQHPRRAASPPARPAVYSSQPRLRVALGGEKRGSEGEARDPRASPPPPMPEGPPPPLPDEEDGTSLGGTNLRGTSLKRPRTQYRWAGAGPVG